MGRAGLINHYFLFRLLLLFVIRSSSLTKQKVNGTQLAAGGVDGTVIVWSYPSGRVLFEEKKHSDEVNLIAWNPFRQDVLATRHSHLVRNVMSMLTCDSSSTFYFFPSHLR